jgi:hypothetical protein
MTSDMRVTVNAPGDMLPAPAIEAPRPKPHAVTQRVLQGPGDVDPRTEVRSRRGVPVDSVGALGVFMRAAESRSFTNAGRQWALRRLSPAQALQRARAKASRRTWLPWGSSTSFE